MDLIPYTVASESACSRSLARRSKITVSSSAVTAGSVFASRRYEDASLCYAGIDSHEGLTHYGLYDTVVARD